MTQSEHRSGGNSQSRHAANKGNQGKQSSSVVSSMSTKKRGYHEITKGDNGSQDARS